MPVSKPFRRTCRQFVDGSYSLGGRWRYLRHPKFATAPEQYVRAFGVLQKDLIELFDYIEPASGNLSTFSYRTHELLMRTCIEVEANFKAIISDNKCTSKSSLTMAYYRKLNSTHQLSSFAVKLPVWHGGSAVWKPFAAWYNPNGKLAWYQAYNNSKHSRLDNFAEANFGNLVHAMCGLVALISAQFRTEDFSGVDYLVAESGAGDGYETAVGGYFRVRFPTDWPVADRYDFNWQALEQEADPFQELTL